MLYVTTRLCFYHLVVPIFHHIHLSSPFSMHHRFRQRGALAAAFVLMESSLQLRSGWSILRLPVQHMWDEHPYSHGGRDGLIGLKNFYVQLHLHETFRKCIEVCLV